MARLTLTASYSSRDLLPLQREKTLSSPKPAPSLHLSQSRASMPLAKCATARDPQRGVSKAAFIKAIRESLNLVRRFKKPPPPKPVLINWQTSASKVVVFDLDETLVHCPVESFSRRSFPAQQERFRINIRPFAQYCLEEVSKFFNVVVFTASHQEYADSVIDLLDPSGTVISHRLYREHCQSAHGVYVKDLRILGRSLADTVIVDNSVHAFGYHLNNGIPMMPWYNDPADRELLELVKYLKKLEDVADVRPVIKKTFDLATIWKGGQSPRK